MTGRVDDALLYCLIAAALVVLAHGIDAVGGRHRDGDKDGWAHSLSLAVCGLALGVLILGATLSRSATDLLVVAVTCAAAAVSVLPLVGFPSGDGTTRRRPVSPWDRAYRVRPARVAQLLSPSPEEERTVTASRRSSRPGRVEDVAGAQATAARAAAGRAIDDRTRASGATPQAYPPDRAVPGRPGPAESTPPPAPEVYEAEETLHDVSEVVGDLGRLLGLDRPERRRRR